MSMMKPPVHRASSRRTLLKAALGTAFAGAAGLGAAALWLRPAHERPQLRAFAAADLAFGTTISLKVLHEDAATAQRAMQAALGAVRDVDRLMSLYRPDSEISRLNRDGHLDQPDARVLAVLQHAQLLSQQTRGAFDVTVQPMWDAAVSGRDTQAELGRIGWRKLRVDTTRLALQAPGMAITLNGLAQGYGVDVALAALRQHGITEALLDTGEFASLGRRDDGQPWTLAVRDPRKADAYACVLAADGRCLATSGDYETRFSDDFSRHHIVDPATGDSPRELASVSVLAPTGMQADGLSTAMMVLGLQASLDLAARTPGVDIFCVGKDGARHATPGFPANTG
jgi:thiamine biosynthesis lipoprotein